MDFLLIFAIKKNLQEETVGKFFMDGQEKKRKSPAQ
jgi:hypothetical protein